MCEFRLVVAVAHDQERFGREFALQAIEQRRIVLRGHALAAHVFVDIGRVAKVAPVRRQLGSQPAVPGKMIGDSIDIKEERPVPALARDNLFCLVEIEAVALEILSAKIGHVEIAADAGRLLEGARAQESTVEWIEAKGLVTAVRKRGGQSALNAAGGDARDRSRETPIGSCREAGEHIIFREPAGAAIAFDDQLARLAVKRAEMILV